MKLVRHALTRGSREERLSDDSKNEGILYWRRILSVEIIAHQLNETRSWSKAVAADLSEELKITCNQRRDNVENWQRISAKDNGKIG